MPLYEFQCRQCEKQFETLVRNDVPTCPHGGSGDLQRLLSMFAVDSESTRATAARSARNRNSKIQRERQIAEHEASLHHHG